MNAGQLRQAVRLLDEAGADDRDIVSFLETGSPGCLLRLGDPVARHCGWREWIVKKDGAFKEYGG